MSFPPFGNNLRVLFYDRFDEGYFPFLESVIIYLFHIYDIVLGFTSILHDMHMYGFVVVGIEQKLESKEDKYRRHNYYFNR